MTETAESKYPDQIVPMLPKTLEGEYKRCVIYARVSTEDQSTKNQVHALYDWCYQRKDIDLIHVYEENASAWDKGQQKQLKQLIADAPELKFNYVLVWSLDRLTRGGALKILELVQKLRKYNIRIISKEEPWTEAPPEIEDILYAIAGWVAQMESRRRSERTKAGLERAKLEGKTPGRPEGSKDSKKRKTGGYKLRQARRRVAKEQNE